MVSSGERATMSVTKEVKTIVSISSLDAKMVSSLVATLADAMEMATAGTATVAVDPSNVETTALKVIVAVRAISVQRETTVLPVRKPAVVSSEVTTMGRVTNEEIRRKNENIFKHLNNISFFFQFYL